MAGKQTPKPKPKKSTPKTKASVHSFDGSALREAYEMMLLIRRFEERAGQLYGLGKIGGFCHLYSGQEAVVVGVEAARSEGDQMITAYRDHGHMLACGIAPNAVMAELLGRSAGCSKGKGGSMHMFDPDKGFYGGHGIVGAQVPIGTGLALANQYRGEANAAFTFFGDGAANQGQVYESFNMAALWQLPVVFIIENNQYAMGTSVERASFQTNFSQRGISFGIEGVQVDGMDLEEVYAAACAARDHVVSGKGPMILEMKTYRYSGHSMSDPAKYRKREEVKEMRQHHDPIKMIEDRLIKRSIATQDELKQLNDQTLSTIDEVVAFAENSPEPEMSELMTNVYVEAPHAG